MEGSHRSSPAGMEVPVAGGGNIVKWIEISVPSSSSASSTIGTNLSDNTDCVLLPLSDDYASSCVIGEPPISFIWRVQKTSSNVLELLQLSSSTEFPVSGLRFVFAHTLSPFAFVYADEGSDSGSLVFFLYAVTASGVLYVLKLSNTSAYMPSSVFPLDHLLHLDIRPYLNETRVTSVAASPGFLFLRRSDGCISCFQPVMSSQRSSGGISAVA